MSSPKEVTRCPSLRRLDLAECYAVDDIDAMRRLTLDELRIIGRPQGLDPELLRTARELKIRRFSAPRSFAVPNAHGENSP